MRSKTYESLEHMVSKGYCRERVENRRRYFRAVPPAELKKIFDHAWITEQKWRKESGHRLFGTLSQVFGQQKTTDRSLDFIEVIRSRGEIHRRYVAHIQGSKKEVLTFNRSPYACLDPEVLEEQEEAEFAMLDRGVAYKAVYMYEDEFWPWLGPHIEGAAKGGEKVRVAERLPMKMFVFDRRKVMMALPAIPGQNSTDFTMLIIDEPGFTESFMILFDTIWKSSSTITAWNKKLKKPR
jgi:sugar-specific transcriptional regulator TrmB